MLQHFHSCAPPPPYCDSYKLTPLSWFHACEGSLEFYLAFLCRSAYRKKAHYLYWFGHSGPGIVKIPHYKLTLPKYCWELAQLIVWPDWLWIYLWLTVTILMRWPNQIFCHKAKNQTLKLKPRWIPLGKCPSQPTHQLASLLMAPQPFCASYFPGKTNSFVAVELGQYSKILKIR